MFDEPDFSSLRGSFHDRPKNKRNQTWYPSGSVSHAKTKELAIYNPNGKVNLKVNNLQLSAEGQMVIACICLTICIVYMLEKSTQCMMYIFKRLNTNTPTELPM